MEKPRVLYLDIDDTLLVWTNGQQGFAAPLAAEFVRWADEHFEVRWLTMWCPSGKLRQEGAEELSYRFHGTVKPDVFMKFTNPTPFVSYKTDGIDFLDPRPWVWVEDMVLPTERNVLGPKYIKQFYPTHVTQNVVALQATWRKLAKEFYLPGAPSYPYMTKMEPSPISADIDAMIDKFRHGKMQNHDANRPPDLVLPPGWETL